MRVTAASWLVGNLLKTLREAAGLKAEVVAAQLKCSASRVYMVEAGTRCLNRFEATGLVRDVYERPDLLPKLSELLGNAEDGSDSPINDPLTANPQLSLLVQLQLQASGMLHFILDVVPGYCQTEEYSRGQQRMCGRTGDEAEAIVQSRMEIQRLLLDKDNPLPIHTVTTEGTLARAAHVPGQLDKLIERAERPNITLEVIPNAHGPHHTCDSFTILQFDSLPDILYYNNASTATLVTDTAEVSAVTSVWYQLQKAAKDPDETIEMIRQYNADTV